MQDIVVRRTNLNDSRKQLSVFLVYAGHQAKSPVLHRDLPRPQRIVSGIHLHHLMADRSDMMNQPQLVGSQEVRGRSRADVEAGEGEHPSALPLVDDGLDRWGPLKVGLVRGACSVLGHGDIVVRTANLVLRAVAARQSLSTTTPRNRGEKSYHWGKFSSHRI